MGINRSREIQLAVAAILVGTAVAANAQQTTAAANGDGLEEVVVTAERVTTNEQKTPISMTVIGGEEISTMGRSTVDDVLANAPNVIVEGNVRGPTIAIRGIGTDLPPQIGQGATSQNYDGVYNYSTMAGDTGYYDLDRVEVLRGPQGTLYGRNATAGVVNMESKDPSMDSVKGYATVEAGNYDLLHAEGAVNVPLNDDLAIRAAYDTVNRRGYLTNGEDDNVSSSGRLKLLFKPNDDVSLLVGSEFSKVGGQGNGAVAYSDFQRGQYWNNNGTDGTVLSPSVGFQYYSYYKFWLKFVANIGPGVLSVLPAYQNAHAEILGGQVGNVSGTGLDPGQAPQKSVEIRYNSLPNSAVTWDAGYYYYDYFATTGDLAQNCFSNNTVFIAPTGYSTQNPVGSNVCTATPVPMYGVLSTAYSKTDAFFGQATYPLRSDLRLTAGARYTWDAYVSGTGGDFAVPTPLVIVPEVSDSHFDYRLGLDYDLSATSLLYASVSTAQRAGGTNPFSVPGFTPGSFSPEKVTSYEAGSKNRFFDNRVQFNADVYYYDYTDYQLVQPAVDAQAPGGFTVFFVNVPKAHQWGAEMDTQFLLTHEDRLNVAASVADSEITNSGPILEGVGISFNGMRFPHQPKWTVDAGYSHRFELAAGSLTPRLDLRAFGSELAGPTPTSSTNPVVVANNPEFYQPGYTTEDVSLLYASASDKFDVNAYVKNLADKAVKTWVFQNTVDVNAPRTYGATMSVRF